MGIKGLDHHSSVQVPQWNKRESSERDQNICKNFIFEKVAISVNVSGVPCNCPVTWKTNYLNSTSARNALAPSTIT
jgi:hypothetical protein